VLLEEVQEFLTGARQATDPERVLATVMFGDIVDSTRRAAELGDRRWRQVLEAFGEGGGIAVHIAARVLASAQPGELLVSGTVKDLVVGSGIGFEDRGEHELRGVPGRWRLWVVAG
jgi:class 3 adenylate cyclase